MHYIAALCPYNSHSIFAAKLFSILFLKCVIFYIVVFHAVSEVIDTEYCLFQKICRNSEQDCVGQYPGRGNNSERLSTAD